LVIVMMKPQVIPALLAVQGFDGSSVFVMVSCAGSLGAICALVKFAAKARSNATKNLVGVDRIIANQRYHDLRSCWMADCSAAAIGACLSRG
jgi:hypothetical protein